MKVFITGIAGFVASNVANRLFYLGYDVTGVDNLKFGYANNLTPNIGWAIKDMNDVTECELSDVDVLLHMACDNIIYCQEQPIETFITNCVKSINVIDRFNGKIVYTSTSSVYGQADAIPTKEDAPLKLSNAYDTSKYITERYIANRDNYTILRLSNVYGENQRSSNKYAGVIGKFIGKAIDGEKLEVYGNNMSTRDYTYIEDVVNAIVIACSKEAINDVVNISSMVETRIMDIIYICQSLKGEDVPYEITSKRTIDGITYRCIDNTKAKDLLGWYPKVNITDGIIRTYNWAVNDRIRQR